MTDVFGELSQKCIKLKENDEPVKNNEGLTNTFNKFFNNIIQNLDIDTNLGGNITNPNITDPVFYALKNYEHHSSILRIKEIMSEKNLSCSFKFIDRKKVFNELRKLQTKKLNKEIMCPLK